MISCSVINIINFCDIVECFICENNKLQIVIFELLECMYLCDLWGPHQNQILFFYFVIIFLFISAPNPGGVLELFLTGCVAGRGLKPLPISKDFSPSKNG